MNTVSLNIRKFPRELNQSLNVQARLKGLTLREYVIQVLQAAAKKSEK